VGENEKNGCGGRLKKTADACNEKVLRRREKKKEMRAACSCLYGKPTSRSCRTASCAALLQRKWRGTARCFAGCAISGVCEKPTEEIADGRRRSAILDDILQDPKRRHCKILAKSQPRRIAAQRLHAQRGVHEKMPRASNPSDEDA